MGQKFVERKQLRNVAAHRLSLLESRRLRAIDEKANGSTGKVKRRSPDLSGASGAAEEQHQIVRGHSAAFGEAQSGIAGGRLDRFSTALPPSRSARTQAGVDGEIARRRRGDGLELGTLEE